MSMLLHYLKNNNNYYHANWYWENFYVWLLIFLYLYLLHVTTWQITLVTNYTSDTELSTQRTQLNHDSLACHTRLRPSWPIWYTRLISHIVHTRWITYKSVVFWLWSTDMQVAYFSWHEINVTDTLLMKRCHFKILHSLLLWFPMTHWHIDTW